MFAGPAAAIAVAAPIAYSMMHGYQRKRIDVFLDPESDPLGAGYHISPVEDRDRIGRHLGQGLPPGQPEPPRLSARGPYRFRLRDHGRGMGPGRRGAADPRLRAGDPLGHAGQRQRPDPLRAARRGRPVGDDLLLRLDQSDDGHGPGAGGRRAVAAGQLRRIGGDDRDAVPRPADGARAAAADGVADSSDRLKSADGCAPFARHATGAPFAGRDAAAHLPPVWTHSSVGRAADS